MSPTFAKEIFAIKVFSDAENVGNNPLHCNFLSISNKFLHYTFLKFLSVTHFTTKSFKVEGLRNVTAATPLQNEHILISSTNSGFFDP